MNSRVLGNNKNEITQVRSHLKCSQNGGVAKQNPMETCVTKDSTTTLHYTDDTTSTNLDTVEFKSTAALLNHTDRPLIMNGDVLSPQKRRYSISEASPKKQSYPIRNEVLLTAASAATSPTSSCKLTHTASRKSSLQYKKISFTPQTRPSNEKRLTLLGKPIVTGVKCKQNVTYR